MTLLPANRTRARSLALTAASACLLLAVVTGCGHKDAVLTGNITGLTPKVCIGTPDASGGCYSPGSVSLTDFTVGECVSATIKTRDQTHTTGTLTRLTAATTCPTG